MADYDLVQVSELTATETPANADVLPIQQGTTLKKITYANLKSNVVSDEANARQNADNLKLNKPTGGNGTAGQLLISNGDGTTSWESVDSTLEVSGVPADAKTVGDEIDEINTNLEDYAKIDGYYEDLTAGNAEELVTGLTETESVPFLFRTAGGSLEIGAREDLTVTGGSLVWNQCVNNNTPTEIGPQTNATVDATTKKLTLSVKANTSGGKIAYFNDSYGGSSIRFLQNNNHVYYAHAKVTCHCTTTTQYMPSFGFYNQSGAVKKASGLMEDGQTITADYIIKTGDGSDSSNKQYFAIRMPDTATTNDYMEAENIQIFDFTQMFGTTIADYILSLETATTGAGVAWFKKLFPKDYYPFANPGFVHVNASEFKTVGFNQWDEQWENAIYSRTAGNTLTKAASQTTICCKNYIPVLPSTTYYFECGKFPTLGTAYADVFLLDENEKFIDFYPAGGYLGRTTKEVVTTANTRYIAFNMYAAYGTTYLNDICISIHWDNTRDGEYEPYTEHSYPLDSSLVLRGLPKIDTDGNLYYDGDTYEADGTVTRRYGIVDLGTLTWAYNSSQTRFTTTLSGVKVPVNNSTKANIICSKYPTVDVSTNIETDKTIGVSTYSALGIKDLSLGTDAAAFKTAMSGVYLVYELATPTTETADPYQTPQIVDNWGTEEFVVTAQNGVEIPVGHSTVYPISLKDKLEASPDLPASNGDYVLRMNNNSASYVLMASEFPAVPTTDGTYTLKATVSSGTATLSWVADA